MVFIKKCSMKQLFKKTEERERFGNKILTKRNKRQQYCDTENITAHLGGERRD